MEAARKVNCIYRIPLMSKPKVYKFDERLVKLGRFQNPAHRRVFLYTWLDTANYERGCKNCGNQVKDIVKHGLEDCKQMEHHRKVYVLRMKLYDVPQELNLLDKTEVCEAALAKKSFDESMVCFSNRAMEKEF